MSKPGAPQGPFEKCLASLDQPEVLRYDQPLEGKRVRLDLGAAIVVGPLDVYLRELSAECGNSAASRLEELRDAVQQQAQTTDEVDVEALASKLGIVRNLPNLAHDAASLLEGGRFEVIDRATGARENTVIKAPWKTGSEPDAAEGGESYYLPDCRLIAEVRSWIS